MTNLRQAMRPKEMIQSLLMVGWTEIGIAQFCGVTQATVNRNKHALYGNPRFNLVSGLQELMDNPTPINRTRTMEPMALKYQGMDRDTIIRLAREAGAVFPADGSWHKFDEEGSLERFAALVAKEERKRICDMLLDMHAKEERHNYYLFIANIIKESA